MLKLVVTVVHTNVNSISVNNILHVTNYWGVSSRDQGLSGFMFLVAGLSSRITWLDTKAFHGNGKRFFSRHSEFSLSVPLHQISKFVFKFKIPQELYI